MSTLANDYAAEVTETPIYVPQEVTRYRYLYTNIAGTRYPSRFGLYLSVEPVALSSCWQLRCDDDDEVIAQGSSFAIYLTHPAYGCLMPAIKSYLRWVVTNGEYKDYYKKDVEDRIQRIQDEFELDSCYEGG